MPACVKVLLDKSNTHKSVSAKSSFSVGLHYIRRALGISVLPDRLLTAAAWRGHSAHLSIDDPGMRIVSAKQRRLLVEYFVRRKTD